MMKNIMDMTSEELVQYTKEEKAKQGFHFVSLDEQDLPKEFVTAAKYISDNIYDCSYFKKDKYKVVFIEEYIPMMGKVWRIIIFDRLKALEKIEQVSNDNNAINLKRVIGGSQVVSIYYDIADVLGIMNQPYFEIYDGNDVERFFKDEYKDLYNCIEDTLSRIIH